MVRGNLGGKDLYMLPIPAKEILISMDFRKLTPEQLSFWIMCGCFALTHGNKITLQDLKAYSFTMFRNAEDYDLLFDSIKHLLVESDDKGIFLSPEVQWALIKANERSEKGKHASKIRWEKKNTQETS